ncbi:MAG: lipoprotein, partial [Bacteroidaceae bacterium]|nr:lipoprotein [Bacteroidaceae bacterium]
MKKIIYILIGLFVLSSCDEWLDVTPNTDVPAKELFTTENGFTSALA